MQETTKIVCVILLLMSGCEQEKAPIAVKPQAAPTPALEPSGVTIAETPPEMLPESQSETTPEATAVAPKYDGYTRAYHELQRMPPPVTGPDQSGLPDPNALNAYLDNLGASVRQLQAEKQAIEQSLAPGEKRAWQEYQHNLESGGN